MEPANSNSDAPSTGPSLLSNLSKVLVFAIFSPIYVAIYLIGNTLSPIALAKRQRIRFRAKASLLGLITSPWD